MDQLQKKKLVTLLLFICCLVGGGLLWSASPSTENRLTSFAQFDALITNTLYKFDLNRQQIARYKTNIDSSFQRKTFIVTVANNFPETKLHLALKQTFHPYNVSLPALVLFPDRDMRIHFSYKNTVLRTLFIDSEKTN